MRIETAVRGGRSIRETLSSDQIFARFIPDTPYPSTRRLVGSFTRSQIGRWEVARSKTDSLEISEEALGNHIWAWQQRACYLPADLFSDPAWGMLLEIFQAEVEKRRATISRLCKASGVSTTSAVRWLKALEDHDLVIRKVDHSDGAEFAELTPKASEALRRYFRNVVQRR